MLACEVENEEHDMVNHVRYTNTMMMNNGGEKIADSF